MTLIQVFFASQDSGDAHSDPGLASRSQAGGATDKTFDDLPEGSEALQRYARGAASAARKTIKWSRRDDLHQRQDAAWRIHDRRARQGDRSAAAQELIKS